MKNLITLLFTLVSVISLSQNIDDYDFWGSEDGVYVDSTLNPTLDTDKISELTLFYLNEERSKIGKSPLKEYRIENGDTLYYIFKKYSQQFADYLVETNQFRHSTKDDFDGYSIGFAECLVQPNKYYGDTEHDVAKQAVELWMNSPSHKEILMLVEDVCGIGVAYDKKHSCYKIVFKS
jgi:uncharacterized protein YkwD